MSDEELAFLERFILAATAPRTDVSLPTTALFLMEFSGLHGRERHGETFRKNSASGQVSTASSGAGL